MKLISDWRRGYRFYSLQIGVIIAVVGFAQLELLPLWQPQLSPNAYAAFNSTLALLLFIARLIKQDRPPAR
ncbi:DUF7940 domain-containing protein [Pseudomonas prosekii]|uniref:DUF7940 domain-containing protein n=1 Tax=Pseudomonas prosekii TaxID=1148509 RepID=UPI00387B5448